MKLQLIIRDKFSIVLFLTVFFLATAIVRAQTETGLPGNAFSGVVPAPNGRLYGLTYIGGTSNQGTLYSVDPALMAVVVHVNFNGANGSTPYDELVFDAASGKFYGATSAGGSSGLGTIFSFDPATNALTTLKGDFTHQFTSRARRSSFPAVLFTVCLVVPLAAFSEWERTAAVSL